MDRLVFGCGYLGRRVADTWHNAGDRVYAVTRCKQRAALLHDAGFLPLIADVTQPESLSDLPQVDTVLYAVGMDRSTEHSITDVYVGGLENVLEQLPPPRGRLVYISSTGVYGQNAGEWVDEDSPTEPDREGGKACLAAERMLQMDRPEFASCVLRLAGIYGPDRLPRRKTLLEGEPIHADPQGWLNLVHVEDAVRVVVTVADSQLPDRHLNVSDGQPLKREEYFQEICRQVDAPAPRFSSEEASGRAARSKRVSNQALLSAFAGEVQFRSFADGLAGILKGERESPGPGAA